MQLTVFLVTLLSCVPSCVLSMAVADFNTYFRDCYYKTPGFDVCIREALNSVRPYFKTGLPQYNVLPFDPFFIREVTAKRGVPNFGFTLTLRNITETGWTMSKVTKFVSDLDNHKIVYTQSFPDKGLAGNYELKITFFDSSMVSKGTFTLGLYDLIQTTTVTKFPRQKLLAKMDVESIRDLNLRIKPVRNGFLENIINPVVNGAWQPGFLIMRPLINELVSTAFTQIFDTSFRNFPFENIFKSKAVTKLD